MDLWVGIDSVDPRADPSSKLLIASSGVWDVRSCEPTLCKPSIDSNSGDNHAKPLGDKSAIWLFPGHSDILIESILHCSALVMCSPVKSSSLGRFLSWSVSSMID